MTDLETRVDNVLAGYMSAILAQSVRRRAQAAIRIASGDLKPTDLVLLRRELESGVRLFVPATRHEELFTELAALAKHSKAPALVDDTVQLRNESDISSARQRARAIAMALGADEFSAQRAITVASELARNVILYAGSGKLELSPRDVPVRAVLLRAIDTGPGIPNLQAILEGDYKSRTGLGKGLRGVRRLARYFDVMTGPTGTTVEAEIPL
jgi:serine/threonine-protein kinase RsbT